MSGRQQHYLPQFLQRRFATTVSGDQHRVAVYERHKFFIANTKGVGQERDYYGNEAESVADETITRAENGLAQIIANLADGDPVLVPQSDYALLVSSLSIRTKAVREAMAQVAPAMIRALRPIVESKEFVRRQMAEKLGPKALKEFVRAELEKYPRMSREHRSQLAMKFASLVKIQFEPVLAQMQAEIRVALDRMEARMEDEAGEMARGVLIRIFSETASPPQRVARFEALAYSVIDAPEGQRFILGDCAVLALKPDGSPRLAIGDFDDDQPLEVVMLPISPTRCIIGRRPSSALEFGIREINRYSASLSHRFFIGPGAESEEARCLSSLIGTGEPLATDAELAAIVSDLESHN